jgi:hypothetical protein
MRFESFENTRKWLNEVNFCELYIAYIQSIHHVIGVV